MPSGRYLYLPLSGGLDSSTCLAVASYAIGKSRTVGIHFSASTLRKKETENARRVSNLLGTRLIEIDLRRLAKDYRSVVKKEIAKIKLMPAEKSFDVTQNDSLMYIVLREIAREKHGLVVGTLDLAEILTGFYPKDLFAGDFLPLGGLLRFEVRGLAAKLGLPRLEESYAIVPGCGSIVDYVTGVVRKTTGKNPEIRNERDLDERLKNSIYNPYSKKLSLDKFLARVGHKAKTTLYGRPVYFPSIRRRILVNKLINQY